jgi:hypothetical protein
MSSCRATSAQKGSWLSRSPSTKPPPWKKSSSGPAPRSLPRVVEPHPHLAAGPFEAEVADHRELADRRIGDLARGEHQVARFGWGDLVRPRPGQGVQIIEELTDVGADIGFGHTKLPGKRFEDAYIGKRAVAASGCGARRTGLDSRSRSRRKEVTLATARHYHTPEEAKPDAPLEAVVVRFAGDSGDGMQLTGGQFTLSTALAGNDLATFPDFPAEIRAPQGTTFGVSAFQINFGSAAIETAGDARRAGGDEPGGAQGERRRSEARRADHRRRGRVRASATSPRPATRAIRSTTAASPDGR